MKPKSLKRDLGFRVLGLLGLITITTVLIVCGFLVLLLLNPLH